MRVAGHYSSTGPYPRAHGFCFNWQHIPVYFSTNWPLYFLLVSISHTNLVPFGQDLDSPSDLSMASFCQVGQLLLEFLSSPESKLRLFTLIKNSGCFVLMATAVLTHKE